MSDVKNKGGRPKGSKSSDSIVYQAYLVEKGFSIPDEELKCLKEAWDMFTFYKGRLKDGRFSPMEDQAAKYLKIYADILKEMANRIYPKLKAIEQTHKGPLDGLAEETMKEMIKWMDSVVKIESDIK